MAVVWTHDIIKGGDGVDITTASQEHLPDSRTCTYRGHNARDPRIDTAVATTGAGAQKPKADDEAIAGDGRSSTQGAAGY